MYREEQARTLKRENADNYTDFLYACHIQMTSRPYVPEDKLRAVELFSRTHRMNLGILPIDETIARLDRPGEYPLMVAEMKDIYGDIGRCGLIQLTPTHTREVLIESLVISCRTRARGLSLAMLIGMLRHPQLGFQQYTCRYQANGFNRPLRMLLLGAGFKPKAGTDELMLSAEQLFKTELPAWLDFNYQTLIEKVY
jgi:predicted enzyme involved in methoxymalonyl-ACP biosynthesis